MMEWLNDPATWTGLAQIVVADILLSGDNALVIALACRSLPLHQQRRAIIFGGAAAIGLRVTLTAFAVYLLTLPFLKLVGGLLLLWIAVKLLLPEEGHGDGIEGQGNMWGAIKTIVLADLVMSVDNVLAVAGAADGDIVLLIIGLLLSIPLIIYGSTMILKLIARFPLIVTLGAAMLGYIGGEMLVGDAKVVPWIEVHAPMLHSLVPILGAILVVAIGKLFAARPPAKVVDLAADDQQAH
ncbi:YjbE family integral membrane protein [Sulfuritortus calidifontis]|uniref:YjbE family integral membrane protein n=1 Tax=Sulfuritortus calidifontis TaxID=1914471 RepID=A0A4V2UQN3_9PROT|nr:TerC family protein [Sulfuritortus calidifontis]TCS71688.1 YjbE family integral membrane protein [Sulfuritortus calidifontis]